MLTWLVVERRRRVVARARARAMAAAERVVRVALAPLLSMITGSPSTRLPTPHVTSAHGGIWRIGIWTMR